MTIFILPDNNIMGQVDYDTATDTMWVYASRLPRDYRWDLSSHQGTEVEMKYLSACLVKNEWLRDVETPTEILELEIVNQ